MGRRPGRRQGQARLLRTRSGFAQSFEALLDPITRAGDGLMDQRVSDADSELTYIKDSLATMDLRLQTKEDLPAQAVHRHGVRPSPRRSRQSSSLAGRWPS